MIQDGIVLIDKPRGMSSFGVVARIRRVLSEAAGRKVKVGHTGTLDPFATGLLILVVGKECRNAHSYSGLSKAYRATAVLGSTSTTLDPEGDITEVSNRVPTIEEIEEAVKLYVGKITQTPPVFSAIKVGGKRAYKLAREGKSVEMPSRQVVVDEIKILDYSYPYLQIEASVSSGTYIRTLVGDIGTSLGVGAYCSELRRISVGEYDVSDSKQLSDYGVDS